QRFCHSQFRINRTVNERYICDCSITVHQLFIIKLLVFVKETILKNERDIIYTISMWQSRSFFISLLHVEHSCKPFEYLFSRRYVWMWVIPPCRCRLFGFYGDDFTFPRLNSITRITILISRYFKTVPVHSYL